MRSERGGPDPGEEAAVDEPSLAALRREYGSGVLHEDDVVHARPLAEVRRWVAEAAAAQVLEPTAATLATVDVDGVPDARVVLLRDVGDDGVRWYTNRASAKGRQLAANPVAAVVLFWPELERQVRLRGRVEDLSDEESDRYFAGRPRPSQVAAWASEQSAVVEGRAALDALAEAATRRFAALERVPRPPHWGGQLLRPDEVELWQGRQARLHDRLRWRRTGDGWHLERLQP
jgi:pyridoxamine 5'-phosphate oxidase